MTKSRLFFRKSLRLFVLLLVISSTVLSVGFVPVRAAEVSVPGTIYRFDSKNDYELSGNAVREKEKTGSDNTAGRLYLNDGVAYVGAVNGIPKYDAKSGSLTFTYSKDTAFFNAEATQWHPVEDSAKKVNGVDMDEKIKSGALILQTSMDGKTYVNAVMLTDIFQNDNTLKDFYTAKDIELVNGWYYRVIVAYRVEIATITQVKKDYKTKTEDEHRAEVYEFYVSRREETDLSEASLDDELWQMMDVKILRTAKDKGYSDGKELEKNDPHFGWKLGVFS